MAPVRKFPVPRIQGFALWASITGLLLLGMLTTVADLLTLPISEAARANQEKQRFVVNAASGEVAIGDGNNEAKDNEFDVGTPDAAEAPDAEAPAEAAPADEAAPAHVPGGEGHAADDAAATEAPAAEAAPETPAERPAEPTPSAEAPAPAETSKPTDEAVAATPAEAPVAAEAAPVAPVTAEPALPPAAPAGEATLRTTPLVPKVDDQPHTKDSLVRAPAPEITETVDGMKLPKRGAKDVIASKLYAHPFKRGAEQVLISFVVVNAGLDPQSIGLAMALPPEVSIAYSPYTRSESSYSENVRALGHEVWTMLPAMGERYPSDDPGPMGIIGRMPPEETVRRTRTVLAAIPGSVGVILPPDETITLQKDTLAPALGEITSRGLLMLTTHPQRNIDQITTNKGMAEIIRRADLFLDPSPNESQIRSRLAGLLDAAKEKGEYVVILTARPQSLKLLADWLKETKLEAPFTLAPLTAIYQPKVAPEAAAPAPMSGHEVKKKTEPPKKKPKVLPQDQYKQPEKKASGGH